MSSSFWRKFERIFSLVFQPIDQLNWSMRVRILVWFGMLLAQTPPGGYLLAIIAEKAFTRCFLLGSPQ
jgi:hypothetical protein